jgi:hypothetical protein
MDILEQFLRLVVVGEFYLLLLWMLASLVCVYVCAARGSVFVSCKEEGEKEALNVCRSSGLLETQTCDYLHALASTVNPLLWRFR